MKSLLILGGLIWTGSQPAPEALLTDGGKIVAVGPRQAVLAEAERRKLAPERIELGGRIVVPGFVDAHVHILSGGRSLEEIDLSMFSDKAKMLERIRNDAAAHPERPWVLGRGWSYNVFSPGLPTRAELDRVVPDRPVFFESYDGHSAWVNSRALALAGVSAQTPDPEGGTITRQKGSREPSGTLLEHAMDLVTAKVPPLSEKEKRRAITAALALAASHGITALCEVGAPLSDFDVFAALDREGHLRQRVVFGPSIDDGIAAWAERRKRADGRRLYPGPLKGFVDGVVESNTASLLAPYADGSGIGERPLIGVDTMQKQIRDADALGIDVAYHAVGDAAVRAALNAFATAYATPTTRVRRGRIEHIETIETIDLPRFRSLGVIASMMPIHADPGDEIDDAGVWARKIGRTRLVRAFPMGDVLRAGAKLAFGSDWPVAPISALRGIAVAVTRQTQPGKPAGGWIPRQKITIDQALAAYTEGAAYACGLDSTGKIAVGKDADFAILGRSAKLARPSTLFGAAVDLTIVAGEVVYRR